ncbi:MAG: hypothetical protein ACI4KM_11650 [Oscillospiraceae bacterium]
MFEVSEKYKQLAQENGRHIFCKILVGNDTLLDDTITGFDFDDVVHPDWYTLGTTCANRFHFTARSEIQPAVNETVKPYISFDGEEWCPLGIFHISRRYVRDGYVSITAYDRLYSMGESYEWSGALPTDSAAVLKDICAKYGLECPDYGYAYKIESFTEEASARDMIGYIAALNNACAKIDRLGRLVLKKHKTAEFFIDEKNCMDIRRNMNTSVITCLKAKSAQTELVAGSGAEISTLEMYNPLMTQHILNTLYSMQRPIAFYGADIQMQGMPFIETGECVKLLHGNQLYTLVVSEVEYTYDGSLTAVLRSKNRCYTDAVVHEDDLEEKLDELDSKLSAMYLKYINESLVTITDSSAPIAGFSFESQAEGFAQIDVSFSLAASDSDKLDMKIFVNGEDSGRIIRHWTRAGCEEQLHVFHIAELPQGKNTVSVYAQVYSGSANIPPHGLLAAVVVHGARGGNAKDKAVFSDYASVCVTESRFGLADITESINGGTE